MDETRWGHIDAMMSVAEDFSDGAWHGFIFGECDIDVDEVVEYERIRIHRERRAPREESEER
jgi:hypothetical protein